jgi:hypothetical protein
MIELNWHAKCVERPTFLFCWLLGISGTFTRRKAGFSWVQEPNSCIPVAGDTLPAYSPQ